MIFECFFIIFNHAFVWTDIETEVAEVPIFQVTEVPTNRYEYSIPFDCLIKFVWSGLSYREAINILNRVCVRVRLLKLEKEREREKKREREREWNA